MLIYWDHNATTPCADEVIEAMRPFYSEKYGNPLSPHVAGKTAKIAIEEARQKFAVLANCLSEEIFFTSGATESNNIIFLSMLLAGYNKRSQIVTSYIEHKSVSEPIKILAEKGFEVLYLPTKNGVVDIDKAANIITPKTALVSVQAANNEIGTLQPIKELSEMSHKVGAYFHTDSAQALGKIAVDLDLWGCNFASFSSHKLYGPKGAGALFVKGGRSGFPWPCVLQGGDQEQGLRPGTVNVPAVVGFGEACALATRCLSDDIAKLSSLRDWLEKTLLDWFPGCVIHAQGAPRLPGTTSLAIPGLPSDLLISNCREFCISSGAACSHGSVGPSFTLQQITSDTKILDATIRISLGRSSTKEDVAKFVHNISKLLKRLS